MYASATRSVTGAAVLSDEERKEFENVKDISDGQCRICLYAFMCLSASAARDSAQGESALLKLLVAALCGACSYVVNYRSHQRFVEEVEKSGDRISYADMCNAIMNFSYCSGDYPSKVIEGMEGHANKTMQQALASLPPALRANYEAKLAAEQAKQAAASSANTTRDPQVVSPLAIARD